MSQRSEIRKHYFLDDIVIISPKRASRPASYKKNYQLVDHHEVTCPFCNNHEHIKYSVSDENGWTIKVVNNLYPAITVNNPFAYGVQEVIIETPNHDEQFADFNITHISNILKTYQNRILALKHDKHIKYVSVFKNVGPQAAASIAHSHSQVFALPFIPPKVKLQKKILKEYHEKHNRCAVCDILVTESKYKIRIVAENELMIALAPYASECAYELWIIPKNHISNYSLMNTQNLYCIAEILQSSAKFLAQYNFDYNIVIDDSGGNYSHTFIKVLPRLIKHGGLEFNSGVMVNPISPELAATTYRSFFKNKIKTPLFYANLK